MPACARDEVINYKGMSDRLLETDKCSVLQFRWYPTVCISLCRGERTGTSPSLNKKNFPPTCMWSAEPVHGLQCSDAPAWQLCQSQRHSDWTPSTANSMVSCASPADHSALSPAMLCIEIIPRKQTWPDPDVAVLLPSAVWLCLRSPLPATQVSTLLLYK